MKHNVVDFLTPKQLAFCNEYLTDFNATRAALRAGYSASTALNGQLMNMPKIKLYLQEKMDDAALRAQVTHSRVLNELCKIAFGNMGNYFAADGGIKPMNELSDDDKAGLWSVSIADAGSGSGKKKAAVADGGAAAVVKFRMYNKLSALDKIAKHIGFYNPEPQEAQTIYSYVTTADINEDDSFDDPILAEEIRVQEEFEENQDVRVRNQEIEDEEFEEYLKNEELEDEELEELEDEELADEVLEDEADVPDAVDVIIENKRTLMEDYRRERDARMAKMMMDWEAKRNGKEVVGQ